VERNRPGCCGISTMVMGKRDAGAPVDVAAQILTRIKSERMILYAATPAEYEERFGANVGRKT
jgi:hypothetical protein